MPNDPLLGAVIDWTPARQPQRTELRGSYTLLRPVDPETDAAALFDASHPADGDRSIWTYLPYGPYKSAGTFQAALEQHAATDDPLFFTIAPLPDERPAGIASYLRIEPASGVIEIGHIWFGTALQQTTAATEAMYLLARYAFDELGYRRLEWKIGRAHV